MHKKLLICCTLTLFCFHHELVSNQPAMNIVAIPLLEKQQTSADHQLFDQLLAVHVTRDGRVDYAGLQRDSQKLDAYLNILKKGIPENAHKHEKLAFWINAYNAFTLKMIIDHYPLKNIRFLYKGQPWEYVWISIKGEMHSLDDIEHRIIRKEFKEPRIHFAVNCASASCPPLQNRAYTAKNLNKMLEKATKEFINGDENTVQNNSLQLSSIFKWYAKDFGNVIAFVNRYSSVKVNKNAQINYREYDWSLNDVIR